MLSKNSKKGINAITLPGYTALMVVLSAIFLSRPLEIHIDIRLVPKPSQFEDSLFFGEMEVKILKPKISAFSICLKA